MSERYFVDEAMIMTEAIKIFDNSVSGLLSRCLILTVIETVNKAYRQGFEDGKKCGGNID